MSFLPHHGQNAITRDSALQPRKNMNCEEAVKRRVVQNP